MPSASASTCTPDNKVCQGNDGSASISPAATDGDIVVDGTTGSGDDVLDIRYDSMHEVWIPRGCDRNGTLVGGPGDDYLVGWHGSDVLAGGPGKDEMYGRGGDDVMKGGGGDDRLIGARDDDVLQGGRGHDEANGGRGRNTCTGIEKAKRCTRR